MITRNSNGAGYRKRISRDSISKLRPRRAVALVRSPRNSHQQEIAGVQRVAVQMFEHKPVLVICAWASPWRRPRVALTFARSPLSPVTDLLPLPAR